MGVMRLFLDIPNAKSGAALRGLTFCATLSLDTLSDPMQAGTGAITMLNQYLCYEHIYRGISFHWELFHLMLM